MPGRLATCVNMTDGNLGGNTMTNITTMMVVGSLMATAYIAWDPFEDALATRVVGFRD